MLKKKDPFVAAVALAQSATDPLHRALAGLRAANELHVQVVGEAHEEIQNLKARATDANAAHLNNGKVIAALESLLG